MNAQDEVSKLEEQRCAAMTSGDLAALEKLLADTLTYTHSSAVVDDKESYIESIRSGRVQYLSVERFETRSWVYGNTIVTVGRARIDVKVGGVEKNLNMRYCNAWVKTAKGWQFALWQSTPIPKT
jgi:ketosteroid isomerase-like protein